MQHPFVGYDPTIGEHGSGKVKSSLTCFLCGLPEEMHLSDKDVAPVDEAGAAGQEGLINNSQDGD